MMAMEEYFSSMHPAELVILLILDTIWAQIQIELSVASSGMAATLSEGGRTADSAQKLPLTLQIIEEPTCNISKTSAITKVLQKCKIIILDECTMAYKRTLEVGDQT